MCSSKPRAVVRIGALGFGLALSNDEGLKPRRIRAPSAAVSTLITRVALIRSSWPRQRHIFLQRATLLTMPPPLADRSWFQQSMLCSAPPLACQELCSISYLSRHSGPSHRRRSCTDGTWYEPSSAEIFADSSTTFVMWSISVLLCNTMSMYLQTSARKGGSNRERSG